ncbi:MAG: cytochrome-c oxidase [Gammaproteobacteria bacterium]|nr:cytochrome-c oxidase [Gammaproteobacteria bacterium]
MNLYRILTEKPWQHNRLNDAGLADDAVLSMASSPQKIALMFFLGVVAVLFALFITAYVIRMELDDWRPMPESGLLWFNTLLLFLSSIVLQWTRNSLKKGLDRKLKTGLLIGALLTIGFIFGQLEVWRQMAGEGYYLYNNPANSFFYVLTGIHGLHILGGLWVWTRASFRVWSGTDPEEVRLSVELCAVYWHFLLLVWLVLFALISYT